MAETATAGEGTVRARLTNLLAQGWSVLVLVLILAGFEIFSQMETGGTFAFRIYNMQAIGVAAAQILLLALGLTLVIVAGHIDLSIAFTTGFAAVAMAIVIKFADTLMPAWLSFGLGIIAGLIAASIIGLLNGWLVAHLRVPSFIGTLGTYGIARGVALITAGGATVAINNEVALGFGNASLLGVPLPIIYGGVLALVCHYLLAHTKFGLRIYAMGANEAAAARAGVNVNRHLMAVFMLSALTSGVGGLLYTGRFSAGAANAGEPILLYAVAAVFIGGASLTGGQGTIVGTVIGAIIIAVIQFGLVYSNLPPYWQFVAVGVVIITAVLVDQWRWGGRSGGNQE